MNRILIIFLASISINLNAQLDILTDDGSLVTNVWQANGVFDTISTDSPYEGATHYRFDYSFTQFWAGIGLNMDNFDNLPDQDLSGYDHLRIAYRGLSGDVNLAVTLRDDAIEGNAVNIGGASSDYMVVDVPMLALTAGTSISLSEISEIVIATTGPTQVSSGTVFIDHIQLINKEVISGTSQKTWARHGRMDKGFNFSNWLEAYWMIPFNAYPEVNRFNRGIVQELSDLGFNSMRLPVTFEQLGSTTPPYEIDTTGVEFDLIDSVIVWAEDFDMTLSICNHHGYELNDANFMSELPRVRAVWAQIIERYGALDPERYFFELSNEPYAISNANFHQVADSLIKDIRTAGSEHSLILGGNGYNSMTALLNTEPYSDPDIIYTFHSYEPFDFTHQQMTWTTPANMPAKTFPDDPSDEEDLTNLINAAKQWSVSFNLPVFMGEFGVSSSADLASKCNYISTISAAFTANNLPFYYWDATTSDNAFGFIENGDAIDCFAEGLELENFNTCDLSVENINDTGIGSLRKALKCAGDNETIILDNTIAGDTILLDLPSLFINKNLTIAQNSNQKTFITTSSANTILEVLEGKTLTLKNVQLIQAPTADAEAINIKGQLIMQNVELKKE